MRSMEELAARRSLKKANQPVFLLSILALSLLAGCSSTTGSEQAQLDQESTALPDLGAIGLESAGVLAFSPEGVLFVGDNVGGAVHAFATGAGTAPEQSAPVEVAKIDAKVASILGVAKEDITINDLAVHPVTREVYVSVTRGHGEAALPAIVKVDGNGNLTNVPLDTLEHSKQILSDVPDDSKRFQLRGLMMLPPSEKDRTKAETPMKMMSIMDIEYYNGELFVAGLSNEEFASTVRRIPYPFTGSYGSSQIKMFHVAHDQWETRAPIRSMIATQLDGTDYLIASYTCSPVVLIPLDELKDGASVVGMTIGDMGNGQPIDMVVFNHPMMQKSYLFVTNNSRMPQMIPLDGLASAKVYTPETIDRGMKMDLMGVFPLGAVGAPVMFVGSSLQVDLLNDNFFVSLTRDAYTGDLDLESLMTAFPVRLHYLHAEYDFPGVEEPKM